MSIALTDARRVACQLWPSANYSILSMTPVKVPGLGAITADKHWRLYYDSKHISEIGVVEAAKEILKCACHLLLEHHKRWDSVKGYTGANDSQVKIWDEGAEVSVCEWLRQVNVKLEHGSFAGDIQLKPGQPAEYYFRELMRRQKPAQPSPKDSPPQPIPQPTPQAAPQSDEEKNGGSQPATKEVSGLQQGQDIPPPSEDDASPGGSSQDGDTNEGGGEGPSGDGSGDTSTEDVQDSVQGDKKPREGDHGSCSDGFQREWELEEPVESENGIADSGMSESDIQGVRRQTAKRMKDRGDKPGMSQEFFDSILNPKPNPQRKLSRLIRHYYAMSAGTGERSYRRPPRRQIDPKIRLAANMAPIPRIVGIIDTSGSMSLDELRVSVGWMKRSIETFRLPDGLVVMVGDTEPRKVSRIMDPKEIKLIGRGGTDMSKLITEAAKLKPKPHIICVCTDSETPWPNKDIGIPVVACLTQSLEHVSKQWHPPKWIHRVEMF